MRRVSLIISIVFIVTISIFSGCDSSDGYIAPTSQAFYVDSAVEGVTASCRSTTSLTDINGGFTYEVGQGCSFWLGNILLREEGGITQGEMVLEDVIEVAQFLQSLDNDNSVDNGITITPEVTNTLVDENITTVPQTQEELEYIITLLKDADIGFGGDIVSKEDAQNHINQTQREIKNPEYLKI